MTKFNQQYNAMRSIITEGVKQESQYHTDDTSDMLKEIMFNGPNPNTITYDTQVEFINFMETQINEAFQTRYKNSIIQPYDYLILKSTLNSILTKNIPIETISEQQIDNLFNSMIERIKSLGLFELFNEFQIGDKSFM